MENLEGLIKQGIIWEDEFVETYLKLLQDKECLEFFDENREEAVRLLDIMIKESKEHKRTLEDLFGEIN